MNARSRSPTSTSHVLVERRAHPRFQIGVPIALVVGGQRATRAVLANLSLGGCFFTTWLTYLQNGRTVALSFAADSRTACSATGRIAWRAEGRGFGVAFQIVDDGLRRFVARIAAAAPDEREAAIRGIASAEIHVD